MLRVSLASVAAALLIAGCTAREPEIAVPASSVAVPPPAAAPGLEVYAAPARPNFLALRARPTVPPEQRCDDHIPYGMPADGQDLTLLCEYEGRKTFFLTGYSKTDHRPHWAAYHLSKKKVLDGEKSGLEREDGFIENNALKSAEYDPPNQIEYTHSGYQRGHLAPSATMRWDEAALAASFTTANIAPQNASLNRRLWKCLEATVRSWAVEHGSIHVVTGVYREDPRGPRIGRIRHRISVPSHFYTVVLADSSPQKAAAFIVTNREQKGVKATDLRKHLYSVRAVEKQTGIDFHPDMVSKDADAIEKTLDVDAFPVLNPFGIGCAPPEDPTS